MKNNTPALGNKPNIGGWEDVFPTEALICGCFVRSLVRHWPLDTVREIMDKTNHKSQLL